MSKQNQTIKIIKRYRYKEFLEIPKSKLWEFVGPIFGMKFQGQDDEEILNTWINYFKSVKVPYIVVKRTAKDYYKDISPSINSVKWLICEKKT